jgi:hypothetical protein
VQNSARGVQDRLSTNLAARVTAPASKSSLQLALENEKLSDAHAAGGEAAPERAMAQAFLQEAARDARARSCWQATPNSKRVAAISRLLRDPAQRRRRRHRSYLAR